MQHWTPSTSEEFDDLLVEHSFEDGVTPSRLRETYAALELFYPRWRGKFSWSRTRIDAIAATTKHTVPGGMALSCLLGAELAELDRPRIGLGMILQCAVGLHPGELVQLSPNDISSSAESSKQGLVIIRLGKARGTKVGREQFVLLRTREFPVLWQLLRRLMMLTPSNERLFPYSVGTYTAWLKKCPHGTETRTRDYRAFASRGVR